MATVFQVLTDKISKDISRIEDTVNNNGVKDMEHYRFLMGQLGGLSAALDHVKTLESKTTEED